MALLQSKKKARDVRAVGEKRYLTVQADYHKVLVPLDEIMYLTIDGRKTKITRKDGSSVRTNRSMKDIYAELPEELFSSINRGIVVSRGFVKHEKNGFITMKDGTVFKRRVRSDRVKEKPKTAQSKPMVREFPGGEMDWWLGDLPMPMCILELAYQSRGSAEFTVRYCNRAMEKLEGVVFREIQNRPVSFMKGIGNPKWVTIFADVAINGSSRILEDLWEDGSFMRVHCYQPQSDCCAVILTDLTREHNLVQKLFRRGIKV